MCVKKEMCVKRVFVRNNESDNSVMDAWVSLFELYLLIGWPLVFIDTMNHIS